MYRRSYTEQRSIIDHVLVSGKVCNTFMSMNIDEEKEIFNLSDHNLIEIELKIKEEKKEFKKNK